jgi:hypothetical protein
LRAEPPFNPLDKKNLGVSVADALLQRPLELLPPTEGFNGAGIYALYYSGDFPAYRIIAAHNRRSESKVPLYVGKAIPAGARKGGFGLDEPAGNALYKRVVEHAESIKATKNLRLSDFRCRYLVVDDIWIPLGESLLIGMFSPLWNKVIDGFGNHDPGKGRYNQQRSPWDVIHPGRPWAQRVKPHMKSEKDLLSNIEKYLGNLKKPE